MTPRKLPRRRYTDEQVDVALIELALNSGSARRAERALAERGIRVPASTLMKWRDKTRVARYQELRATAAPKIEAMLVDMFRDTAVYATQVQRLAIERVEQGLLAGELDVGQAVNAAYKLGIAAGIPTDKMLVLTNRPDHVTGIVRTFEENVAELKTILPGFGLGFRDSVEGSAIDVTPTLPPGSEHPDVSERP